MQAPLDSYVARHLRFGWWSMLLFAALGLALELMHSFKLGLYLDVSNETRRFMWTLAHAHGVLLGLVHVGFAATLHTGILSGFRSLRLASNCMVSASILLPGGFFAGGLVVHGGDPGLGILAVPVGALLLLTALFLVARGAPAARGASAGPPRKRSARRSSSA